MQIEFAIVTYLAGRRGLISPKTVRIYTQSLGVLAHFLGERDVSTITIDDLRAFRGSLYDQTERYASNTSASREAGHLSVWTIHGHIRFTRQFFRWLWEEGKIPTNPAARLELPTLGDEPPKGITESDLRKMLELAAESPRDYAILLFLADTGCRIGGAAGLRLEDLDFDRNSAIVHEKGKAARKKTRAVFFQASTAEALKTWLCERSKMRVAKSTDAVFVGRKGALTTDGLYQAVQRIGQRAGIEGRFNPHSFRHGLARALLERGLDLSRVSRILGHSDERVTAKFYAVFSQAELSDAHSKYSWIK